MINWPTILLKDAAFGHNTNQQFELLNLKACKIWYMLDGSYVAVKTVGSKPYSKKIVFYICTGLYSKQPCGWITWSPHIFSQLSK